VLGQQAGHTGRRAQSALAQALLDPGNQPRPLDLPHLDYDADPVQLPNPLGLELLALQIRGQDQQQIVRRGVTAVSAHRLSTLATDAGRGQTHLDELAAAK